MLKNLDITNYALIESLSIDFATGFSVITGETGAGKSIILGALGLVLGQRAETKSLFNEDKKCLIEATFDLNNYQLQPFFEENGLEYEPISIIRREILPGGRSRAFINDTPTTLPQLKELGMQLIDIHSQHQNQLLCDNHFQLKVIDTFAQNKEILTNYQTAFKNYKKTLKEIERLKKEALKNSQEEEYLQFQYDQLSAAKFQIDEQEELENEQQLLSHAEEVKETLYIAQTLLDAEEKGILLQTKELITKLQSSSQHYTPLQEMSERIQSNYIDLKDIANEITHLQEGVEANPIRLQIINERLDLLYSLQQKHHLSTINELLDLQETFSEKLSQIAGYEEEIATLQKEAKSQLTIAQQWGKELSESRKIAAAKFSSDLVQRTLPLGMPHLQFKAQLIDDNQLEEWGAEQVQFLFTANKNQPLLPVIEVASGGEISRLMLSLKSLIATAMALPTIVFDEVDTGVSGEIADKMGDIMYDMSRHLQVMAITHLPQVAAKGELHYQVYKDNSAAQTTSHIVKLNPNERIQEIARMLSGKTVTDTAIANAKTLLGV